MAASATGDDHDLDNHWNTDDELEIDNYRSSPPSAHVHPGGNDGVSTIEANFSSSSPSIKMSNFVDMGFSDEMIARAIRETGGDADTGAILDALFKYSVSTEASSSKSRAIDYFLGMGFAEEMVIKAIQENGEENMEAIANTLLRYAEEEKSRKAMEACIMDWSSDDDESPIENYSDLYSSSDEGDASCLPEDVKLRSLMKMGFKMEEVSTAIERCGENAAIDEVADFIFAAQLARQSTEFSADPDEDMVRVGTKKRQSLECDTVKGKKQRSIPTTEEECIRLPNPMIGFGVPNEPGLVSQRTLPEAAHGLPYFYYENVALAPKGVWDTISSFLFEVTPEFVDSKYFCAAARKRGYIHNLPIHNRFELQPPPKYTIHEAFPLTKRWWPSWDTRTKLNCLQTAIASAKLTERIRDALENSNGDPPIAVQKYIIGQCRKWNLVWVGRNKVAPLEADEIENLLGFPRNHTRGGGISRTDRYKSLGNSFQVDTVAYHLSVLKELFPNGLNVLSLFSGIGGAEVALHRLQIPMKTVVSVEISKVNQDIMRSFWEQTNQKGVLIHFGDVQELTKHKIEELMDRYGGFDLVIGGSPCNNLAGSNRVSRVGLEGKESSLFFEYCRILGVVRDKTRRMRRL
ncbi:PREDICTED: DNA (cytosine-5)-methyltransferase DRM2 [Tarenaya hassleriana]|uniref:DNA (cytosine-5)-methyltransferase DRM2 n=1 Tax=Tarenaya hassleriana TaxID=28532 RepID=UPI00053C121C|nr:PREDICTED: DNA (cytosine-5)-methyltransferase DRM2 [Tarenaya hassleriana]XP_010550144.1 PREDICTED: DNA (cytosine-5)-methyltransferase DRM2 [Tarenaya hassleriana]XP_010550145.1 PREDICTED: DNA (cytosine-5)-methyltransferase DRM2 [Tarenaya hassleriana]XP_010550146.1 PREDICTED: DNA (cytosine-5)-methyltransferase DRM2 [Tarenaya hassleriana]XP_010550147.1 PREDICTED: DNA (cytosine-5)-methyltransferase DRM2 [Tarenaya hassleriana]